jgi:hypothetical protein
MHRAPGSAFASVPTLVQDRLPLQADKRQRLMTLATFSVFTEAVSAWERARDEGRDARQKRRKGESVTDPLVQRRLNRASFLVAERAAMTCEEAVTEYLRVRRQEAERRGKGKAAAGPGLSESTAKQYERMLRADFLKHPKVRGRKLRELVRDDVLAVLDGVNERGAAAAEQASGAIASLCTWAVKARVLEESPARDLPTYYVSKPRDRVLTIEELKALLPLIEGDVMKSGRVPKLALVLA